jgi:WD40 repeat protein
VEVALTNSVNRTDDEHLAESVENAPYRGLSAFRPEDAEWYFGRERLVDELVTRLDGMSFFAVFGASGSGKTSLLHAGLLPAVRAGRLPGSEHWTTVLMTPGPNPLAELAVQVASRQGISPGALHKDLVTEPETLGLALRQLLVTTSSATRALVIVDQFEELFTLCADPAERNGFVAALLAAAASPSDTVRVVLGVRADFYGRCADHPSLVAALRDHQVLIGPMTSEELRRAILEPASRAGLKVEPALVHIVLTDLQGRPGALPLLSHALLETWRRRRGNTLTASAYQAAGGVRLAIGQSAERAYQDLTHEQRGIARNVFVRLTALGEAGEDTSRRVDRSELLDGTDQDEVRTVLEHLAKARLLALGAGTVEVVHEALIREWPRLRDWLSDDRDSLRLHRRLTEAAAEWQANGRDEAFLYRGARLAAWQGRSLAGLNDLERVFLMSSRHRELREHAARRRRNRVAVGGLSLALVVISALALLTAVQRDQARDQRDEALSRQLATSSSAQLSIDPELSLLLARQAFTIRPTLEAESALRQAVFGSRVRVTLRGHRGPARDVDYSFDGQHLTTAGEDGTVRVWDLDRGDRPAVLRGHDGSMNAVAFSPDGRRVAGGDSAHVVWVWDRTTPKRLALRGHRDAIRAVAWSPDGRLLASASDDGTVRVWNARDGAVVAELQGHTGGVGGVAFSHDGRRMASGDAGGTIRVWETGGVAPTVLRGHTAGVSDLAFAEDGRVASASEDGTVRIWDTTGVHEPVVLRSHDRPVASVAFSPDGRHVVSGGDDNAVRVWESTGVGDAVVLRGHQGSVYGTVFRSDGKQVASVGDDGVVRLWEPTDAGDAVVLRGHEASVGGGIGFSADGRRVVSGSDDRTVRVWDWAAGSHDVLSGHTDAVYATAFSADGRLVASVSADRTIRVWHLTGGRPPLALRGHGLAVFDVGFGMDGRRLVTASGDETVRIWDITTATPPAALRGHSGPVYEAAFSPDGRQVVSGGEDGTVRVWDSTTRRKLAELRGHRGPVGGVAFGPDDRVTSGGYDGTVRVWDPSRQSHPVILRGHSGPVVGVAVSPDGRWVASASVDGTARLWDIRREVTSLVVSGHTGPVHGITFSPDGRRVATAGIDATVRVWACEVCGPIEQVLALAERRSTRELTAEESAMFLHER